MFQTRFSKRSFKSTALLFASAAILLSGCAVLGQAETRSGGTGLDAVPNTEASGTAAAAAKDGSSDRLEDILARGYIEVATEPYFAPNEFIDPTKPEESRIVGADIELARYIADALGVECRIVPLDFTAVLASVTEGKYDMAISALAYTPARNEAMELSKGYYFSSEKVGYGLLVRKDSLEEIKSVDDLADKTVVVQSGSLQEQFAQEQVPAYGELKRVSATTDGFLMVQEKKADACITAVKTAELYMDANPDSGMCIVPGVSFEVDKSTEGTRIGIPKGETRLLERVNEIIDDVIEKGLFEDWYTEYEEYARSLGV